VVAPHGDRVSRTIAPHRNPRPLAGLRDAVTAIRRPQLLALALALGALLAPSSAQAAAPLRWSKTPTPFDGTGTPTAVSCASESLCVAVDNKGRAFTSTDPTAASPSWSEVELDHGEAPTAVSCAPSGLCVAVDGHGRAFANADPGASAWSPATVPDESKPLSGVSCPSSSLCVAVGEGGDIATSTSPASGAWVLSSTHPGDTLTGVSCASQTLCVALDSGGDVLASGAPTGDSAEWPAQRIDATELSADSCSADTTCVAIDAGGDALASADPLASAATWSITPVDGGEQLAGVSCVASGLCVGVDARGKAQASDDPTAAIPVWSESSADTGALTGVSCLPGGFCLAVDAGGHAVAGRVPPPEATTLAPPGEITETDATLAGKVNPNDAVLSTCTFEYGTSLPYTQSTACATTPAASGGPQPVSAPLTGLAPNTTYHYRVTASSPSGAATGADETFTTLASPHVPIIHPNPSITGTPANGQVLTCHAGTPAGAVVTLAYAWLRDQVPIAGATNAAYGVKGQDTGHHLQCRVTTTDGGGSASATSAFVTIPVGGVPASAGETAVGKATFTSPKLSVPVSCSTQASGGCELTLRLTSVETLSGSRVVAVAARAKRSARASAAALRHRTVTLASVRVHLLPGAHATVTVTLTAAARRLLAAERTFTASLYVTGTVIGVIQAQLAQQLLTLTNPPHHRASTHAARRR
jgi:hypothetical protein